MMAALAPQALGHAQNNEAAVGAGQQSLFMHRASEGGLALIVDAAGQRPAADDDGILIHGMARRTLPRSMRLIISNHRSRTGPGARAQPHPAESGLRLPARISARLAAPSANAINLNAWVRVGAESACPTGAPATSLDGAVDAGTSSPPSSRRIRGAAICLNAIGVTAATFLDVASLPAPTGLPWRGAAALKRQFATAGRDAKLHAQMRHMIIQPFGQRHRAHGLAAGKNPRRKPLSFLWPIPHGRRRRPAP